ncbi:hypothetical protein EGT07_31065, partial [Herbaspirillum sp. HC18]
MLRSDDPDEPVRSTGVDPDQAQGSAGPLPMQLRQGESGYAEVHPRPGGAFSRMPWFNRAARDRGNKPMPTYYFDIRDGVPVRDRSGLEIASDGAAI